MSRLSKAFQLTLHLLNFALGVIICVIPALYFLSKGLFDTYLALSSPTWKSVASESFFVIEYDDYRKVSYSYRVVGQLRGGERISFSYPFPEDEDLLAELKDGQVVQVYYSPHFPAQSTLQPGWRWGPVFFILLGMLMGGLGWLAFWMVSRHRTHASIDPVNWLP